MNQKHDLTSKLLKYIYPDWEKMLAKRQKRAVERLSEILAEYPSVDHLATAKRMYDWCLDHDADPGLKRFRMFIEKRIAWDKEKAEKEKESSDLEGRERSKTSKLLEEYRS